jgi:hypothetical protein
MEIFDLVDLQDIPCQLECAVAALLRLPHYSIPTVGKSEWALTIRPLSALSRADISP